MEKEIEKLIKKHGWDAVNAVVVSHKPTNVHINEACGPNEYWNAELGRCVPDVGPQPE